MSFSLASTGARVQESSPRPPPPPPSSHPHGQDSVHPGVDRAGRSDRERSCRTSSRKGGGGRRAPDAPAGHPPEAAQTGHPVGAGARRDAPRVRAREPAALPAVHRLASARVLVAAAIVVVRSVVFFPQARAGRVRRARCEGVRRAQFEAQGTSRARIAARLACPLLIGYICNRTRVYVVLTRVNSTHRSRSCLTSRGSMSRLFAGARPVPGSSGRDR